MDSKDRAELELRRRQMASSPFCSDHRDKLKGKPCRECEIEHLKRLVKAAKHLILAATGPEGPESWIETRDRWLNYVELMENLP
jgi:hypothetical protein